MLHDPLLADGTESVCRFSTKEHDSADNERRGTKANPDRRPKMHEAIIRNRGGDCKHSRIGGNCFTQ